MRDERPEDHDAIHAVHAGSFPTDAEARLVDALREGGHLPISLVAEAGGQVVGHVAFSPVRIADEPEPEGAPAALGLAPVAVLPEHRRRGIADGLIRAGLDRARELGVPYVVVLGDPAYYGRFGFEPASRWGLRDEYGGGDAFQAQELMAGAIPDDGGVVQYAAEFADLG